MNKEKMDTEKKVYEEPTVKMVEFDFSDRIAASGCAMGVLDTAYECMSNNSL